jgi:hypothetical protein
MSRHSMSAAAVTTSWMAGSYRNRCHRYATDRDRGGQNDECFTKHLILLIPLKQEFVVSIVTTPDRH